MTKHSIKHRITGSVLFELECGSLKLCLEAAVKTGADLADADLARAYLAGANLAGAAEEIPVIPHIDAAILSAIIHGGTLDMSTWHGPDGVCGTTHCRAGWAVHLGGIKGKALEKKVGTQLAGAMIYRRSRPGKRAPWFFDSSENTLEDIKRCADADPLPVAEV